MGTSGSSRHDFVVADNVVIPPEFSRAFSERLIYLSPSFFVSGHAVTHADVLAAPRASKLSVGAADEDVLLSNFNTLYKVLKIPSHMLLIRWRRHEFTPPSL
jgi:predicted O-linked N-acetylglucosamine transferase (SPINDLY family)